ncbi:hypothetical protein [Flavobacterium urocaniciphilum]|uniref:Lipoprotein n=1 Tax=Flavobacterium urocaniciphilum TaxID=1299341 RepID=A0A1H8Z0D6_9FLAO|nr:hypothetical protein [Flavobacterium urocaniciphilum]SEP57727.1 hypothetical protein SAMN05444005_101395 [Flavobacterium urocaniciphilum]
MKTIKNLLSIFVIITSLSFVSCEDEPLDQSLINNINSGNNSGGGIIDGGIPNNGNFKVKINGEWFIPSNVAAIKVMPTPQNMQLLPSYTIVGALTVNGQQRFMSIQFFYNNTFNFLTGMPTTTTNIATISYSPNGNAPDDQLQLYTSVNEANPFTATGTVNLTNNDAQHKLSGTFNATIYLGDENGNVIDTKSLTEGTITDLPYTIE